MFHRLVLPIVMICLPALASGQSPLDGLVEADLAEGQKVFKVHCARCHGIAGQGGEGSNLVRSKLKYAADDQALIDLIGGGIPGTGMPAIWTRRRGAGRPRNRATSTSARRGSAVRRDPPAAGSHPAAVAAPAGTRTGPP